MGKKVIKINESQIKSIVRESLKRALNENAEDEGRFLNWLGLGNRRNAQQQVQQQQPMQGQPQQQMQGQQGTGETCPKCGNPIRQGARFCNKCGENLTGESSFCKYCGKPKKPNQKFCSHCGKYIENTQGQKVNEGIFDKFKGNNFNMSLYQMGQYVGNDGIQFSKASNTYRYHGKDLLDYCSNNQILIDGVDTHIGPSQNMNQGGKTTPEEFERMKRELKTWLQTGLPKVIQGLARQQKTQQWYDNETNVQKDKMDTMHRQIQQDAQDDADSRYYKEMTRPQQYMGTNPLHEGRLEQIVNNTIKKVLKESVAETKKKKKHN